MISKLYKWLHDATSGSGESGEYSAGYWQDKVRRSALRICAGRPGKLLEVGCGEGLFLAKLGLLNTGAGIWGIDIKDEMLKKAEKRIRENGLSPVNLQRGKADSLPFKDSFFDTVVCVNVLFNLGSMGEIEKAIKEMARVCAAGGSVIFDYRNALNPLLKIKYKLAPYYDPSVRGLPLTTCRPDEIDLFLREAGLETSLKTYISFPKGRFAPIILLEARKSK